MKSLSFLLLLMATSAFAASPSTVNNDDSCDVTVGPAATLLLPYFEADVTGNYPVQTTFFSVVNVTRYPQIAHVTLWTDRAYPVMAFNVYLAGYAAQTIDIGSILVTGVIGSLRGTSSTTPVGSLSVGTNPNLRSTLDCASLPGTVPQSIIVPVRDALTKGVFTSAQGGLCDGVGNVHANAIGYATIDVVASCTSRFPSDPLYYTNDLLFDNVLIGDYQQIRPHAQGDSSSSYDAGVNPLVHIRAVPEGGGAGSNIATALPYTFYDRYTPAFRRTIDRRQPLPATFAARFVQGGPGAFRTNINIWREGFGSGNCSDAKASATMAVADIVRFDEHENPFTLGSTVPRLPVVSSTSSSNSLYPALGGSDTGGWFYLDLNNGGSTTYSATHGSGSEQANATSSLAPAGSTTTVGPRPSQNWVMVAEFGYFSPYAAHVMAAEFDAASLGNGCSPAAFPSTAAPIGPSGGVFACPPGTTLTNGSTAQCINTHGNPAPLEAAARVRAARTAPPTTTVNNDDSCDIKVGPAATLLLPHFEVDVSGGSGQTTLFTVTNVTRYPQIAHVTLWTDYAYPVMTLNLYLGGYDVQTINLADVLIRNTVAPPNGATSSTTPGSLSATTNPNLRASLDCANIPGVLPATIMETVRKALTSGLVGPDATSCNNYVYLGGNHVNAIGYATIDVVASCTTRSPADPLYYTNDLLFDNVLIGDYQQIGAHTSYSTYSTPNYPRATDSTFDAAANPMVHIRAVPEGGGAGANVKTGLPYTFYDRYTPAAGRTIDRRQPLPSTFAARFVRGGTGALATVFTIWREGFGRGSCQDAAQNNNMPVAEFVAFDDHDNPFFVSNIVYVGETPRTVPLLPATSWADMSNTGLFPSNFNGDLGSWLYLNLNNGGSANYSVTRDVSGVPTSTNARTNLAPVGSTTEKGPRPSQNWVTISMFGYVHGQFHLTGEFDAAALGNGCTPAAATAEDGFIVGRFPAAPPIAPAGGVFVCPPGTTLTNGSTTRCIGTNVNPPP
jgi:hypothetical protein